MKARFRARFRVQARVRVAMERAYGKRGLAVELEVAQPAAPGQLRQSVHRRATRLVRARRGGRRRSKGEGRGMGRARGTAGARARARSSASARARCSTRLVELARYRGDIGEI